MEKDRVPVGVDEDGKTIYHPVEVYPEKKAMHPAVKSVMKWFKYKHLPDNIQWVSQACSVLAEKMAMELSDSPEKTKGLGKLLEAKDCFVRARLDGEIE